jgi:hypothetical protein
VKTRTVLLQSAVVIALAGWRLANPAQVAAAPADYCGQLLCVDDCEGGDPCRECPGYACFEEGNVPCGSLFALYCFAHS